MADVSSSADSPDPFASDPPFDEGPEADRTRDVPPWEQQADDSIGDVSPSVAVDVARMWVQQHQKASMLGAFAVGVFAGAMLRQ